VPRELRTLLFELKDKVTKSNKMLILLQSAIFLTFLCQSCLAGEIDQLKLEVANLTGEVVNLTGEVAYLTREVTYWKTVQYNCLRKAGKEQGVYSL
jgi:hypothetical protein